MRKSLSKEARARAAVLLVFAAIFVFCAARAFAWGRNANKLIVNQAIDTLPPDVRSFFDMSRGILLQHVTDPLDQLAKTPAEKRNNHLYLDKYGRFPFDTLPRDYKAALEQIWKIKTSSQWSPSLADWRL